MAVQQNKKSPSRRGMRRAHHGLRAQTLATDSAAGDRHYRHHITASGFYRGRQIIAPKTAAPAESDAADEEA